MYEFTGNLSLKQVNSVATLSGMECCWPNLMKNFLRKVHSPPLWSAWMNSQVPLHTGGFCSSLKKEQIYIPFWSRTLLPIREKILFLCSCLNWNLILCFREQLVFFHKVFSKYYLWNYFNLFNQKSDLILAHTTF